MKLPPLALAAIAASIPLAASAQGSGPDTSRYLAASCAICHGTNGQSAGGMPVLAGQSKETLLRHMQDFKAGKRPATIMHQITRGYSDQELEALAAFFASQKLK